MSSLLRGLKSPPFVAALLLFASCRVYDSSLLVGDEDDSGGSSGSAGSGGSNGSGGRGGTSNGGTGGSTPSGGEGGDRDGQGGESGGTSGSAGASPAGGSAGSSSGGNGGTGGTSAGTSGSGGGGTGGTGGDPTVELFDDFEDANNRVKALSSRNGYWYVFNDGAGTQTPATISAAVSLTPSAPPANLGKYGLHMTATGFETLVGIGANFREPKEAYDASAYSGLSFWARGAAGRSTLFRVLFPDSTTDEAGGDCDDTEEKKCGNHFGIEFEITEEWARYEFSFADAVQDGGWGNQAEALDLTSLFSVQITAVIPTEDIEIWIDEFELKKAEAAL